MTSANFKFIEKGGQQMQVGNTMQEMVEEIGQHSDSRKSETLNSQVYLAIREKIICGDWLPGTKLTLRGLAAELGTSIQPIRDAVGRLMAERSLSLRPNHSVVLPPIDRALMDDVFSLRNMLEGEAVRRSTLTLTPADFVEIEAAIHATRIHYATGGSIRDRVVAIQKIAIIFAKTCGSTLLAEQLINLRTRTAPYYAAAMAADTLADNEFITFTIRIQDEFVAALKRREAEEAANIRKADLYTYQHYIYRLLKLD
jgi:DNA-binding GntR family transcriptional regulator